MKLIGQYLKDLLQPCIDDGYDVSFTDGRDIIDVNNIGEISCDKIYVFVHHKCFENPHYDNKHVVITNVGEFKLLVDELSNICSNLENDGMNGKYRTFMYNSGYFCIEIDNSDFKEENSIKYRQLEESSEYKPILSKEYLEDVLQVLKDDGVQFDINSSGGNYEIKFYIFSACPIWYASDLESGIKSRYDRELSDINILVSELPNIMSKLLNDGYASSFNLKEGLLKVIIKSNMFRRLDESINNVDFREYLGRYYKFQCRNYDTGEINEILISLVNTYNAGDKISLMFFDRKGKNFKINLDKLSKYSGFDRNSDKFYDNISLLQIDNEGTVVEQFFVKPADNNSVELIDYTKQHCS